jgi:predicted DNA-binding ArsR family transcriptional regulator
MPELSRFYGIIIRMFYGDHPPPHFHAVYQDEQVQVHMSRRGLALVLEWAALHREELHRAWEQASTNQEPSKIPPLE